MPSHRDGLQLHPHPPLQTRTRDEPNSLYALHLPGVVFRSEGVRKRTHAPIRRKEQNLHNRRRRFHFHRTELNSTAMRSCCFVMANNRFELTKGELVLPIAGHLLVSVGKTSGIERSKIRDQRGRMPAEHYAAHAEEKATGEDRETSRGLHVDATFEDKRRR